MTQDLKLEDQILRWQQNKDSVWADRLITSYRPFILKTIAALSGRYIEIENDDEFSIGLQAFYEAMLRFDPRGNFLAFARLVIASRLKSYWQKEHRQQSLCLDELELAFDEVDQLIKELSMADDIMNFARELACYGLTFSALAAHSPKHRDTREKVLKIAHQVCQSADLIQQIQLKKKLPIQKICLELSVSPKVIKRNKIYLLAAILVFCQPESDMAAWLKEMSNSNYPGP